MTNQEARSRRALGRLFDDESVHVDRFGAVLVLSILAVSVNMLIDLNDPTATTTNEIGWIFVTVVSGATLIAAAAASGVGHRWRRLITFIVVFVVVAAVVSSIASASGESSGVSGRPTVLWVLVSAATPWFVLRRIFKHQRVTGQTLAGAVSVYLLLALAFAYALGAVDQYSSQPIFGSEQGSTSFMYFSMVTITTLGYGDLSPVTTFSRYLATTEALLGQIFLVTVVARLVALFGTDNVLGPAPSVGSTPDDESGNDDRRT